MVVPPRLIPLPLLACALLPIGSATAAATKHKAKSVKGYALPCIKDDGQTLQFAVKPKSCTLKDSTTQEPSLVTVSRLSWSTWTASRAKAAGVVHGEGYAGKVGIVATKPKRCSPTRVIYTDVKITIRLRGESGSLALATYSCPT